MLPKTTIAFACLFASVASIGFAQQAVTRTLAVSYQDNESESTLPPVEVRPPATGGSDPESSANRPLPMVDSTGNQGGGTNNPASNNTPSNAESATAQSYPSLSQQQIGQGGPFGGTTGVLRSQQSLFDTPAAATIVTRQQIEERQASDMLQALQNEVGVMLQSTAAGQASPFVRGLTGQQVLLLVDGIRMNNSFYRFGPNQYFNTIDPGMVDHIEVLRGQGSVLFGSDAIGGAINVVTRSADPLSNYGRQEFNQTFNTANSASYSRMNVEGSVGGVGVFAGGGFLNERDLDTGFDDFTRQPGTNYQQYSGDIKLNYLISEREMVTIALQHFEQEDVPRSDRFPGYPGDRDGNNAAGTRASFFNPQQRDLAYLRYQAIDLQEVDALTFTASYHRQREAVELGVTRTGFQEVDVDTVGLSLVAAKDYCDFGKVTSGVDWYYDDIDSSFGGVDRNGNSPGAILPDDAYYSRIGAFLNWEVPLTQRLNATAGARYEHISLAGTPIIAGQPVFSDASFKDWVAQVGFVYKVNSNVRLVGSISEGFRAPNLDELFGQQQVLQNGVDLPSLGLTPEHSINYEVGVKTNYNRLRTQTFVFWTDLSDNIVPVVAGANQFGRDNQDSFVQGLEFNGDYLLTDYWSVYGNFWYTYGKNRVTGAPLSRIPPMQGILGLRFRDPRLQSYFAVYTWMSDRQDRLDPVRDLGDERIPIGGTPGFATLNMRAGRAFGACKQHRVSLGLENITDQPYLVHGSGVFGTGFTTRLGYTWTR